MDKRKLRLCGKLIACCVAFIVVLSTGLASKAAIFFMTSSMGQELKELYPGGRHRYAREKDTIQHVERFACWMWSLFFSFAVPELFGFLQSLHICLSRQDCWTRPRFVDFTIVLLFETAHALGMALLFGSVLPCLSVVHGILITNCLYLVPALFNFLSRKPDDQRRGAKMTVDGLAFLAQLSGCLHLVFIRRTAVTLGNSYDSSFTQRQQMVDYMFPLSVFLVSLGWWENHVDKDAPVGFIKSLGRIKENTKNTRPFIQLFVSLWKLLVFLGTMLILISVIFPDGRSADANLSSFLFIIKQGLHQFWSSAIPVDWISPLYIFVIQSIGSLLFYWFGTFACKIGAQRCGFALPVVLITPVLISTLTVAHYNKVDPFPTLMSFGTYTNHHHPWILLALSFIWFLSQTWITLHIWEPVELNSRVTDTKWYNSLLIEHSVNLSSPRYRNQGDITLTCPTNCTVTTRIFAVATMWHESSDEMMTILKSIFRMDKDQSERRANRDCKVIDPHLYHYDTHIFFDDAFQSGVKDSDASKVVNQFVNEFISMVDKVNSQWTNSTSPLTSTVSVTPYGGRMVWILPGKTKMTVHLKDKTKIRIKKRWSQVMYIEYLIRYEMENCLYMTNVLLLTLDGDMKFRPKAVHTLVDLMNSQKDIGIVCNRSHPIGSAGATVWYQIFEYAIGFWLLKPSEDLLGSILCASGCFSIIRASVLLDEEIMNKFTALSEEAHHMIQRDQGEDRWLCTLLIKRGYRLAYCANSSAYTHCPETFEEFYNQRRRWALSLIANTLDVIWNCKQIVKVNPNISWLYIVFQAVLLTMGLLCPGSILLALVYISATTFCLSPWISLSVHSVLIFIFVFTCFLASTRVQLKMAKCLSVLYGLILAAVVVYWLTAMAGEFGIQTLWSIHNVFFLCLASCIALAGCLHPSEIRCLLAGPIYLLLTPSMSILLLLYSIINLNVVSWGTRDSHPPETARPSTEIGTKDTKNYFNSCQENTKVVNAAENLQISNEDSETSKTTHQISIDVACQQPYETKQDSEESSGSKTPTPWLSDQDIHRIEASLDWDLETEVKLSKQLRQVKSLSDEENSYWNNLIAQKLFPIVDSSKEHKERISADLIRLRNWSFTFFILLNSLFVALIFGMQVNDNLMSQSLHSTDSLNYYETLESTNVNGGRLSQTTPVHITLVFLAGLMLVIQFTALLVSRVKNLIRILSSVHFTLLRKSPPSMDSSVVLTRFNTANQNEDS